MSCLGLIDLKSPKTAKRRHSLRPVLFQSLPRNQVPEWAGAYINYKGLKKIVKAAAEKARNGETVDPAGGLS